MLNLKILRKFAFFIVCISFTISINGQSVMVTAAADVSLENVEISYSVGQLFYESQTVGSVSFLEGVQRPIVSIPTSIKDSFLPSGDQISIYPNPVDNVLFLNVENEQAEELSCRIYDINGQILADEMLNYSKTTIDMQLFASSLYLVRVFRNNILIKDFKVLKK